MMPSNCWGLFHERVCLYSHTEFVENLMRALITHWPDAQTSQGPLKVMIKFGAAKAHQYVGCYHRAYGISGQAYFDPMNKTYAYVLKRVWEGKALVSRGITNTETMGDVVEALLGFAWFLYHPENIYAERNRMEAELCYEMIEALHEVIAYTYDH